MPSLQQRDFESVVCWFDPYSRLVTPMPSILPLVYNDRTPWSQL
jgi:hypothetical protein